MGSVAISVFLTALLEPRDSSFALFVGKKDLTLNTSDDIRERTSQQADPQSLLADFAYAITAHAMDANQHLYRTIEKLEIFDGSEVICTMHRSTYP